MINVRTLLFLLNAYQPNFHGQIPSTAMFEILLIARSYSSALIGFCETTSALITQIENQGGNLIKRRKTNKKILMRIKITSLYFRGMICQIEVF